MASKTPSAKTIKRWCDDYKWLEFTAEQKMVCKICTWRAETAGVGSNGKFVVGSTNYQFSTVKDHSISAPHDAAVKAKEHANSVKSGVSLPPRKIVLQTPSDSAIAKSLQQMNEKERETVTKLLDIAYYIALHGLPFSMFQHQIKLEKLHKVSFTGAYENGNACKNFIIEISDYLFLEKMKKKLELVNFISILCDGSTDKSITEQEVIYVIFVDPETNLPVMKFFEVAAPESSQDAVGLKETIISAFNEHGLESVVKKIVFLSSDGASVNCGSKSGLIKLFQEDHPWVSFIWCFSHRLELAIKDALQEFLEPVETSLLHLYYLYTKSSKKYRELKSLHQELKGQFEMYGNGVKPVKSNGTRWIDHKVRAMGRVLEKFGLYVEHLKKNIPTIKSANDRATVQGKLNKLVDAKVVLRSAFFTDVLAEAKRFSLISQKKDINVIKMLEAVETTKSNYQRLLSKVKKNPAYIFELPNLKLVTDSVSENGEEDGDPSYQGHKLKYYSREKRYLEDHGAHIIEQIIGCFEQRYGNLFGGDEVYKVNVNSDEGDRILFGITCVLNCNVWCKPVEGTSEEDSHTNQLASLKKLFNRYREMGVFAAFNEEQVIESFLSVVRYGIKYFNVKNVDVLEFWSRMLSLQDENPHWRAAMLLIEICLCAPVSNASLERLFSQMNFVKSTNRNRLKNDALNAVLRIRISDISVEEFHANYVHRCANHWYNKKGRRANQSKRKKYKKRAPSTSAKRPKFDISELSSSSSSSSDSD